MSARRWLAGLLVAVSVAIPGPAAAQSADPSCTAQPQSPQLTAQAAAHKAAVEALNQRKIQHNAQAKALEDEIAAHNAQVNSYPGRKAPPATAAALNAKAATLNARKNALNAEISAGKAEESRLAAAGADLTRAISAEWMPACLKVLKAKRRPPPRGSDPRQHTPRELGRGGDTKKPSEPNSSQALDNDMQRAMRAQNSRWTRPTQADAHHIVPGGSPKSAYARSVLDRFGIKTNTAPNGVYLPSNLKSPNPDFSAVHSTVHSNMYYTAINRLLSQATSKERALEILEYIRTMLLSGEFPW
ncbi:AHH domain-containing protein [Amycolatopsis sp. NPDC059657]|uniref:AHH domain-containing protein n=1 Tax=Amycolatopsis sp. NPDC059657 TaxID=3346899 RepID=UPI00366AE9CC